MASLSSCHASPPPHDVVHPLHPPKKCNNDFATYTVQISPTPDNQPLQISASGPLQRVEEQYASSSLFTSGHDRATKAQLKDKVVEPTSGPKGSLVCQMLRCDVRAMRDENGQEIVPCGCDFKICKECYRDAMMIYDEICPGFRESYEEDEDDGGEGEGRDRVGV
ncbi:hypothetical protein CRG98_011445 [Punica granatum]|uniref:Uncharacterized protein n=1 Tax=Punica granatum TaxID=22663 RepID=A0A2I0KK27_PUNGR|nr:hypothetical protein CRG98_011445 [Punica granatum]